MGALYSGLVRPVLFRFDSENVHDALFGFLRGFRHGVIPRVITQMTAVNDERLAVRAAGIDFRNPLGLAAGFDKQAQAVEIFEALSFGHVEVGTITGVPQDGNPKPRIFRLPHDRALINRMGFPSIGVDAILPRLRELSARPNRKVLGVNIGKAKVTHIDEAAEDYVEVFRKVAPYSDYVTVNVSSPNTPDLRRLQEPQRLASLFRALRSVDGAKPVFVKISPDLTDEEVESLLEAALDGGVSGFIATNTTLSREGLSRPSTHEGGLSGLPLRDRSVSFVRRLYQASGGRLPIVGVGGISSAEDVLTMYRAGASLVQLYTALIYEGPFVAHSILEGIISFMDREGIKSLLELHNAS